MYHTALQTMTQVKLDILTGEYISLVKNANLMLTIKLLVALSIGLLIEFILRRIT